MGVKAPPVTRTPPVYIRGRVLGQGMRPGLHFEGGRGCRILKKVSLSRGKSGLTGPWFCLLAAAMGGWRPRTAGTWGDGGACPPWELIGIRVSVSNVATATDGRCCCCCCWRGTPPVLYQIPHGRPCGNEDQQSAPAAAILGPGAFPCQSRSNWDCLAG